MASLLVERLCHDPAAPEASQIAILPFVNYMFLVINNNKTASDMKTAFVISGEDATEFDTIFARITAKSNTGTTNPRDRSIGAIAAVLQLNETGLAYATVAEVRTFLLNI